MGQMLGFFPYTDFEGEKKKSQILSFICGLPKIAFGTVH